MDKKLKNIICSVAVFFFILGIIGMVFYKPRNSHSCYNEQEYPDMDTREGLSYTSKLPNRSQKPLGPMYQSDTAEQFQGDVYQNEMKRMMSKKVKKESFSNEFIYPEDKTVFKLSNTDHNPFIGEIPDFS